MYRITVGNGETCTSYTIPNDSLRLLAYTKMKDKYGDILMALDTEQEATEFLEKIGIHVKEL